MRARLQAERSGDEVVIPGILAGHLQHALAVIGAANEAGLDDAGKDENARRLLGEVTRDRGSGIEALERGIGLQFDLLGRSGIDGSACGGTAGREGQDDQGQHKR